MTALPVDWKVPWEVLGAGLTHFCLPSSHGAQLWVEDPGGLRGIQSFLPVRCSAPAAAMSHKELDLTRVLPGLRSRWFHGGIAQESGVQDCRGLWEASLSLLAFPETPPSPSRMLISNSPMGGSHFGIANICCRLSATSPNLLSLP